MCTKSGNPHSTYQKYEFAEQLIEYCLINYLNKEENVISITTKVFTHSFQFQNLYQDEDY